VDIKPATNDSVLGRLLEELSWVGSSIRAYRDGGRGFENVLTAEVLTALDFLPREAFLGAVVRAAHGADAARMMFVTEVEQAEVILLPDEMKLRPSGPTYQAQLVVQPDGVMMSSSCYVLLEAKRIRRSSFQAEQLAREYVALMAGAEGKSPLLLLILGSPPPVTVKGHGRLSIEDAVSLHLAAVLDRSEHRHLEHSTMLEQLPAAVAWITWHEVAQTVSEEAAGFPSSDPSVIGAVRRLANSVTRSIERHS
jgi:hypothetical protein